MRPVTLIAGILIGFAALSLRAQDTLGLAQDTSRLMVSDSIAALSDPTRLRALSDSARIEALRDSVEEASRRIRETFVRDSVASIENGYQALTRSWRLQYPFQPVDTAVMARAFELAHLQHLVDSLMAQVRTLPYDEEVAYAQPSYRIPLVVSGEVPRNPAVTVSELANSDKTGEENLFQRQLDYTRLRQWTAYNYETAHLREMKLSRGNRTKIPYERKRITKKGLLSNQQIEIRDNVQLNYAQATDIPKIHADKWHWKGTTQLQMTQTSLSDNWYKGGENNMTLFTDHVLDISRYDENKITTFETVVELKLSAYYTKTDTVHPMRVNDNLFTLNMKYGYKAWKKWYYSANLYAKTPVFEYYKANSSVMTSTFLAPLEVNVGLGMDYSFTSKDKGAVFSLMLAPLSYNLKYIQQPERVTVTSYGIDENHRSLNQFGAALTSKLVWKFSKKFQWSSRLYIFTSYESVLGEFENTFSLKLSDIFSAQLYLYPRFDDSTDSDNWQMKETSMLGLSFTW